MSVVPSNNQKQKEIFEAYKHFKEINEISVDDDDLINLNCYEKINKIIFSKLCQLTEESGSLQKFQENYSINEEEAFIVLNLLYRNLGDEILNHPIIPNKNGLFMLKSDLRIDPKIDEKMFELFLKLDQSSEIPEEQQLNSPQKIVNPNVKIEGIDIFDVVGFIKALNKKVKAAVSNPNVDREIHKMINECTEFDFANVTSDNISEDQKNRMKILHKAHIAFIKNRINELNSKCNRL